MEEAKVIAKYDCPYCGEAAGQRCLTLSKWEVQWKLEKALPIKRRPTAMHEARWEPVRDALHKWERSKTVTCPGCAGNGRITRDHRSKLFGGVMTFCDECSWPQSHCKCEKKGEA